MTHTAFDAYGYDVGDRVRDPDGRTGVVRSFRGSALHYDDPLLSTIEYDDGSTAEWNPYELLALADDEEG